MKKTFLFLPLLTVFVSCVSYDNYYKLDPQYLERRQLETRRFETEDEDAMLVASSQVLQDLGFTLAESETKLGLMTATKNRSAVSGGQVVGAVVLAAMFGGTPVYDTEQKIYTTLVSSKSRSSTGYNVRIEFARIVWNNQGGMRVEVIGDPDIYKEFFDKLGQSLFLVANEL